MCNERSVTRNSIERQALAKIQQIISRNEETHNTKRMEAMKKIANLIKLEEKESKKKKMQEEYERLSEGKVPLTLSEEEARELEKALKLFYNIRGIQYGETYTLSPELGIRIEVEGGTRRVCQSRNYASSTVQRYDRTVMVRRV
ncbi:MAG: hypothetical protein AMQ74_01760 [Candidatus Methanofastidiosum methylothiophilum]|uniref:Uncharacterized protein n=1 Tax=Candidatus Methanofastidiosum methylothiophilum TaxID=1705564 RepID=A0A150IPF3_9EURY|nr:MAG: hypothetical protein AMQ74_01760 [Candidatus Methanofastidiosum methylthiophilus]